MAADRSTVWRRTETQDLPRRWWEDQLVVYHPGSGDTHLLNLVAGEVLESLQQSPANVVELTDRVALRLDRQPDEPLLAQIEQLLHELDELGLVEVVPP
jgi:PqqD family protein of HPr-rel-A system